MPSIINRVKNHTKNFTILSNYVFEDNKLSARAMGLYCYLMHLPKDWKIYKTEVVTHFKEGQKAMNTAFKELETFGYLSKEKTKQNGRFTGWKYTLYEISNNSTDIPISNVSEEGVLLNTNKQKKKTADYHPTFSATISKKLSIENPSDEEFPEQGFFENNEKDTTKKEEPINELIIFWNKFDCFSKHKNRTTKLYKLSNRYTSEILNNKFIENHKIDKNWKINNNIKTSILKNITIKQLKQIIIKYSLQFNDNYLPENKSVLPKSFPNFIYNPKTQKSQLLWMLNHEPALKNEVTAIDVSLYRNKLDTAVAHKIDELLKYKYSKISDKHRMSVYINAYNTVKQLHEIYQKVKSINKENFIIQFSGIQFVTKWLSYLENKPTIVPADFNATGFTFQNFITYCVRQYTVDLDYSEEHIKQKTKRVKQVEVRKVQEVEVDSDNLLDIVF